MGIETKEDRDFAIEMLREGKLSVEEENILMDRIDAFDQQGDAPTREAPQPEPEPEKGLLEEQIEDTSELIAPGAEMLPEGTHVRMETGEILPVDHWRAKHPNDQVPPTIGAQVKEGIANIVGVADITQTIVTGALAEPIAGYAGLIALTQGEDAAAAVAEVAEKYTWAPRSEKARKWLGEVAAPLAKVEQGIDDLAVNGAAMVGGGPATATALKTIGLGLLEATGLVKGTRSSRLRARNAQKAQLEVEEAIKHSGIDPTQGGLEESIMRQADKVQATGRDTNAGDLHQALIAARQADKDALDAKFKVARDTKAMIETAPVRDFNRVMQDTLLRQGRDIANMPTLRDRLTDLQKLDRVNPMTGRPRPGGRATAVDLEQFETIRRRINSKDGANPSEQAALVELKRGMDNWLDEQLTNDMISGDPAAIARWKDARGAHSAWKQRFDADRMIVKLLDKEATPQQINNWIFGASTTSTLPQATATIKRLTDVLGPDHPAIKGLRHDFTYRMMEPLMGEKPNYQQFINQYDSVIKKRLPIAQMMGVDAGDLAIIRRAAATAKKLPGNTPLIALAELPSVLSRVMLGNKLAKATLKVNLGRNLLHILFRNDRVSRRQIIRDLAGVEETGGLLTQGSKEALPFIAAASFQSLIKQQDDEAGRNDGQ